MTILNEAQAAGTSSGSPVHNRILLTSSRLSPQPHLSYALNQGETEDKNVFPPFAADARQLCGE